jgi:hypothetical protein
MRNRWAGPAAAALALGFGIFLLYFLAYPIRHLSVPAGFDAPYYVWRAQHLLGAGIGHGTLASRPGYPILSALLGSVTGLSQLDVTIFLSMVLIPVLALVVGAFVANGLDRSRLAWVLSVASAGVVMGATQLVGENLANILNIALEVAALVPLAAAVSGEEPVRGLWAAVGLIVASGMSHWIFLPLFFAVLGVGCFLAMRRSLGEWRRGVPLWRTESGLLASAGAASAGITAALVGLVLRAPFRTIEIAQDSRLFRKKIRTDAVRLMVPGSLGILGIRWIPSIDRRAQEADGSDRRFAFSLRILAAWTWVMGIGLVFGILTWFLPPTRFLAHLIALSGAVTVAILLTESARWLGRRFSRDRPSGWLPKAVPALVVLAALALLSLPGLIRWYPYPVLMDREALAEARIAGRYVSALPPGQPVVFLTDYLGGKPGAYATVMIDRTIRIGMPRHRDTDVFVVPGTLEDLLAGRRTPAPNSSADRISRPYWEDVRGLLPRDPPILVLRATGIGQYEDAVARGAVVIAPGVARVRGPDLPLDAGPPAEGPSPAASLASGLGWGLVVLVLLWLVGAGWTRVALGSRAAPEVYVSLAPAVGAAALILGGLLAAEAGIGPAGPGGIVTVAVVALAGWILGPLAGRVQARALPAPNPPAHSQRG